MNYTLKKEFELSGVGLHSGALTQVRILPTQAGKGRYFVRVDLPTQPIIPAQVETVSQTTLSTELVQGEGKIRTVEHLLAALIGSGVDDAQIEINGAEVPLLDGSAQLWVEAIASVGIVPSGEVSPPPPPVAEPIWIREGDSFVAALPSSETCFTYGIDFPYKAIGNQWYSWKPTAESFAEAIAPARTFGFADQIEKLRQAGLIQGGSLDNALVCDDSGWLNPPLRFANEPVRHKLLDLVGDLSLLGKIPQAHFLAYKASHHLHVQLAKALTRQK
jgi:UDP-3-O-[3-hydroxymyristoyl] N-acetylglucosamine deacetylase